MNTQQKYSFLILIGFLMATHLINAQEIYNVFTNESLKLIGTHQKEVYVDNSIYKNKIKIRYFEIDAKKSPALKMINDQAYNLCYTYASDESKALKLYQEYKEKLEVYNEMNNSKNSGYSRNACSVNRFQLTRINSQVLSMIGGKIYINVRFLFGNGYSRNYEGINITHYYVADLKTGKIERYKNTLTKKECNLVQKKIAKRLNETYSMVDMEDKYSALKVRENMMEDYYVDEDAEELSDSAKKALENEDVSLRVQLNEADIYWFGWGLIIDFQEYTKSSKIYYGDAFHLFLPWNEAKEIFSGIAEFSFLNELSQPKSKLRGFNLNQMNTEVLYLEKPPTVEDILKIKPIVNFPKGLTIQSQRIAENGYISSLNKVSYQFNNEGLVLSKNQYQDSIIIQTETFEYDLKGNLIRKIIKNRGGRENSKTFVYDAQNNLIKTIRKESFDFDNTLYFYNGIYIYSMPLDAIAIFDSEVHSIRKMSYGKQEYRSGDLIYLLNVQGDVIGKYASINNNYQTQIGRDSLGRIVESHSGNDRNNYYWNYDSLNRITSFQNYNNQNTGTEYQYYYQDKSLLPIKEEITKSSPYSTARKNITINTYSWEY